MKRNHLFWGLFFLGCAAFLVFHQLGLLASVSVTTIIITLLIIPIMIRGIIKLEFFEILSPIALLYILYSDPLGYERLSIGSVIWATIFSSVGLSILFGRFKSKGWINSKPHYWMTGESHGESTETLDSEYVNCLVRLGASSKYINSTQLKKAEIHCSFGGLKVYFDNAQLHSDTADVYIDASFSGIELYVPRHWNITNNISATVAGIDEKNKIYNATGPTLNLMGNISFSGVEIIYV